VWKLIKRLEQCIDEFYRWQAFLFSMFGFYK
jgi:hypothetical protein